MQGSWSQGIFTVSGPPWTRALSAAYNTGSTAMACFPGFQYEVECFMRKMLYLTERVILEEVIREQVMVGGGAQDDV